jgi:hypothetical protein
MTDGWKDDTFEWKDDTLVEDVAEAIVELVDDADIDDFVEQATYGEEAAEEPDS